MRFLYVCNGLPLLWSTHEDVVRTLLRGGHEVHLATPYDPKVPLVEASGARWHELPMDRKGLNVIEEGRLVRRLMQLYEAITPDLVHHATIKPILYGGLAARLVGVARIVSTLEGLGYMFSSDRTLVRATQPLLHRLYRAAFSRPNHRLVVRNSDDRADLLHHRAVPPAQIHLVKGYGVDTFRYAVTPEEPGEPLVVLPARMLRIKGLDTFVEAARMLKVKGVKARFVLAGGLDEGNPSGVSIQELEAWQREGVVEWWGMCSNMPAVYRQAHIVCLPTRYREGVPRVLLEAAASARATVASDIAGCREIVRDGESGKLVPPGDATALAAALRTLIEQPGLRRALGLRGREIIEQEFTIPTNTKAMLEVYRTFGPLLTPKPVLAISPSGQLVVAEEG